jgi:hypothetical protein
MISHSAGHAMIENDKLYNESFIKQLHRVNQEIKVPPRFFYIARVIAAFNRLIQGQVQTGRITSLNA